MNCGLIMSDDSVRDRYGREVAGKTWDDFVLMCGYCWVTFKTEFRVELNKMQLIASNNGFKISYLDQLIGYLVDNRNVCDFCGITLPTPSTMLAVEKEGGILGLVEDLDDYILVFRLTHGVVYVPE